MGKIISIALFVLLAEAGQAYLYGCIATRDMATIGLLGPLAGALAGASIASLFDQLLKSLNALARNVIFVSIVVLFISAGTTYYQCYAEQITHDARVLHPRAEYASVAGGDNPWMMYPKRGNAAFGTGCKDIIGDVDESVLSTLAASFIWLPVVLLISWFTTRKSSSPRDPDVREALPA